MPIPLPDLDDRTFDTLVEESIRAIPRRAPSWTDHNRHDPGITFVELFAWLTEMHRFTLDRIGDGHVRKFLELLGTAPRPAAPAAAVAVAEAPPAPLMVPRGTRVSVGGVPFETAERVVLAPVRLVAVIGSSRSGLVDLTAQNLRPELTYPAFGPSAEAGSRLYLGFDGPFPEEPLVLAIDLFEGYRDARGEPVPRGSHAGEPVDLAPSAEVVWEYSAAGGEWRPLAVTEDGTAMFSLGGRLRFEGPPDAAPRDVPPLAAGRHWLRASVRSSGFELPPLVESVRVNTLQLVQRSTLSEAIELSATGESTVAIPEAGYLARQGVHRVQVRGADGLWRDRDDARVGPGPTVEFSSDPPPAGQGNVRLVSAAVPFAGRAVLGSGDGLPGQAFRLPELPVVAESFRLEVREASGEGLAPGWREWSRVDDLDASGPGDRRFTLDPETGAVRFGDGLRGLPAPPDAVGGNLRVISYRAGGGEAGNLPAGALVVLDAPPPELEGIALALARPAAGGAGAETLEAARRRARRELGSRHRAVTAGDFEELALATPGLRVARARALPLFAPGLEGYPERTAPAAVTVVVAPFAQSGKPVPSRGFLGTVCRHLDRHRLITTKLHVVGPGYVEVGVEASVVLLPGYREGAVLDRIVAALDRFLHPLTGGPGADGWPFGRTVHLSEVYELLDGVEGVDCVREAALAATGAGARRTGEGGVAIPPHGLVCPGSHRIRFAPRQEECRVRPCDGKGSR